MASVSDIDKGFNKRVAEILKLAGVSKRLEVGILDPGKTHVKARAGRAAKNAVKRAQARYKKLLKESRKKGSKVALQKVISARVKLDEAKEKAASKPKPSGPQPTIGEIAERHEYGLGVPQRSFIRSWYDGNKSQIENDIRTMMRAAAKGGAPANRGLQQLGALFAAQIQKGISAGIAPANHPDTIKRKGSSTPLIDTGQLRSAISWRLV